MEKIIGLKEFREDVQKVAESVARGNEYVVVKRSRPLFRVVPTVKRYDASAAVAAARKLAGIWKDRKMEDPVKWQRRIRAESERKLNWPHRQ